MKYLVTLQISQGFGRVLINANSEKEAWGKAVEEKGRTIRIVTKIEKLN